MKASFRFAVRSLVFGSTLAVGLPAQADAQADLTGDWVLSIASSDLGQSPAPDSAFLAIEASGEKLVMTGVRYYAQHGVTRNTWFDMRIDGKVHPVRTDDGEFDSSASWEDETLAIFRVAESNVGELELSERLWLKDDAATLVRSIDILVPGMGEDYQVMEYKRRE